MANNFTKKDILWLLGLLNDKLKEKQVEGELQLYGGAVMSVAYNARPQTHDVDGLFEPKEIITDLAEEIAKEKGLESGWLNDGIKGFLVENETTPDPDLSFSHLTVSTPNPKYMLALKIYALRGDEESSDKDDIAFLIDKLGIETVEEAEAIALSYYPKERFKPLTHYILEEILHKVKEAREKE